MQNKSILQIMSNFVEQLHIFVRFCISNFAWRVDWSGCVDFTKVYSQVDPLRDTETIFQELRLKDIEYLTNNIEKVGKVVARMGDKDKAAKNEYETMLKVYGMWHNTLI